MPDNDKQPFMTHLEELRRRLITCAIAIGIGFVLCYFFSERLFQILVMPLKANMPAGDRLIFTNLPEMFFTYLKTAFLAGAMLVAPMLFYQICTGINSERSPPQFGTHSGCTDCIGEYFHVLVTAGILLFGQIPVTFGCLPAVIEHSPIKS